MDILPNEIESIKTIGNLYDNDVKMVQCVGGFFVAVGKKKKSSKKAEALSAGSHPALVSHQLSKEFGSDFKPAIFKSEQDVLEKVEDKSKYLSRSDIEKGVELYTLSKGGNLDFILYKNGITLGQYKAEIQDKSLVLKSKYFNHDMVKAEKDTAKAIAMAMKDKMYELNLSRIKKSWK